MPVATTTGRGDLPPSHGLDLAWYLLKVSPLCEGAVEKRLKRQFGESIATYVPIARYETRRRGKRHEAETVVFPGYVFLGFIDEPQWLYVRDVLGVLGVFAVEGAPMRIDATLVGDLMSRCVSGSFNPVKPPKVQRGMHVVAKTGPYRGSVGQVAALSKGDQHAHVLFELFNGTMPARIHLDDLVSVSYASMRMIG